jgi:hypothetical protein
MVIEMSFSIRPLLAKVYMKAPFIVSTLLLTTVVNIAFGNEIQTKSEVCGNPAVLCRLPAQSFMQTLFEPYDLAFQLPKILNWQSTYYSENFYAIILKSNKSLPDQGPITDKPCAGYFTEDERLKVQKVFPEHKVFASRFGCSGHPVFYTNTNRDYNFLAIFAGLTMSEAKILINSIKTHGFYDANIRKMQVSLDYGD